MLVARRVQRLDEFASHLEKQCGVEVTIRQIDLSKVTAARQILDATSSLDVGLVISNAGFGLKGAYSGSDPAVMTDMLMVNCNTPMQLAHGFIPRFAQAWEGRHRLHQFDRGPDRRALFHGLFRDEGIRERLGRRPVGELSQKASTC